MTKETLTELKKLRDYFESGEYKNHGHFHMGYFWCSKTKCGCSYGHYEMFIGDEQKAEELFVNVMSFALYCFLFSDEWQDYDNTVECAIGRIDAVLAGLRF